jgi:hypothetical protein
MDSLSGYKYRGDVVVIKDVNEGEAARLIASAYATICLVILEVSRFPS